jgi:hypothetical protein
MLQKAIANPNVQRRVSSMLSKGGRGNNTFMQKAARMLSSLMNNRKR